MDRLQARKNAIVMAQTELVLQPVYLDTETTGLETTAQIVDICIVDHDGSILLDSLVKPKGRIPADATRIHGITNDMVKDAPAWPDLWPRVEAALTGRRVAIYNAEYDVRLLMQTHDRYTLTWAWDALSHVCVMRLYAQFVGEWNDYRQSYRWHRLEDAVRRCGITGCGDAHRARADALAARGVLHHMAAHTR